MPQHFCVHYCVTSNKKSILFWLHLVIPDADEWESLINCLSYTASVYIVFFLFPDDLRLLEEDLCFSESA